jgi:hypothetical protein
MKTRKQEEKDPTVSTTFYPKKNPLIQIKEMEKKKKKK